MASTVPSYGRNSFVPPAEPPPLRIAVWVGNKQKLVTGLLRNTTCEDVVQALAHQEQLPAQDQWMLYEAWGKEERPLRGRAKVAKVLRSWGEDLPYVKFSLRRRGSSGMARDYTTGRSLSNPSLAASNFDIPPQQRSVSSSTLPYSQQPNTSSSSNSSLRRSASSSSISSQEDHLSQSRREANADAINKLLTLMQDQDKKLKEQMQRIREVENQIEEHETQMHMSRIQEDGVGYIQAGYLIPSDDGSSGSGSSGSGSGDETVLEPDEDVPEAEAYVTICEEVSRMEEQLATENDRIKSISMLIKEASQGVTGGLSDSQSLTGDRSLVSEQSLTQHGSDGQAGLADRVQQEIKCIKEAMQNSLYVSMSQEEQLHKMNQALNNMQQQLKGKEEHLNHLLQELDDPQSASAKDNVHQQDTTSCQETSHSATASHNSTEYSILKDNALGGGDGLINNILLRYKQNLEQIQAAVQEDSQVNNTSINNTSSSSDDSHDSGISGSDPEKDSDCGSSTGNSPEKQQTSPEAPKLSSQLSVPSLSHTAQSSSSDLSQHQHLSQISVICQNSTMTNETLPNDTLQPLEVLVDTETVLTSTPVQVQDMEPLTSHLASRAGPSSRGLLDHVRLRAHLAQAALTNQTDDGKRGQEDEGMGEEEEEEERDVTIVEGPADDTYTQLCVRKRVESDEEEEEEEEEEQANNTFKMALKSPMPARKRVAFAERDSIREITMYSMNTTMLEASAQEEEAPMDSINITQDLTNTSGDIRCWGMACSSSKKKYTVNSSKQQQPPPLPPRNQPRQQPSVQPDRFLVTLHPHTTLTLSQPGSAPPTPLVNRQDPPQPQSQDAVTAGNNHHQAPEEKHLENESYRQAVYNFSPANESCNNYLSASTGQLSMVYPSKSSKAPAKNSLFKLSSSGVTTEVGKKETSSSKKLPFVKRFKMPWHSEKKANKEVKIQVVTEKSMNQSEFYDTFNDSYRHALTVNVASELEVKSKPSVGQGQDSSTFADRLVSRVQRGGEKDNTSNTQGGETVTPSENTDRKGVQSILRHSLSEGHMRRNSVPNFDTNLEVDVVKQSGSQSATTTPRKHITPRKTPSCPGTPKTPNRTPRRLGNDTFNKSLGYTPLGRSYTMPEISKIGYSWIYQYEEDSPLNCSGGPELDATLMETDCRQTAEQCSPGSNSVGYESEGEPPSAPLHGKDMIPYCTYSTFDNDGNYSGSKAQEDCNSDTGLSSMNSDDIPVLETLV